jgi:hypothetical protein
MLSAFLSFRYKENKFFFIYMEKTGRINPGNVGALLSAGHLKNTQPDMHPIVALR